LCKEKHKYIGIPHLRDFFEISVGVDDSESNYMNIGSTRIKCEGRNVLFISPIQPFSVELERKNINDKGFLLAFKPSILLTKQRSFELFNCFNYFSSYTKPHYILDKSEFEPIFELVQNIFHEYEKGDIYSRNIIGASIEILLYKFKRVINTGAKIHTSTPCEYIATKFEKKIIEDGNHISKITNYASELNVSTNYLSECVKKSTGITAIEILKQHKLVVAKTLLLSKEMSIAEISFEMNFSEPTNFTKFFKQMTGITPNQFRKGLDN
jgi:AraC-like DNA-binding protein